MSFATSDASEPDSGQTGQLDAIVDAVCQGRLTPADVCGLRDDELDALYAWGQVRFESGQLDEAVLMWGALVALDPYQARAWRALGIGHHHRGAMQQAHAAYCAALYLEPAHALTAAYAVETHLFLGQRARAEYWAGRIRRSADSQARERLEKLLRVYEPQAQPLIKAHTAAPTAGAPAPGPTAEDWRFCLADGRPLPLADSTYPSAGQTDETTLVYDLAQALRTGAEPPPVMAAGAANLPADAPAHAAPAAQGKSAAASTFVAPPERTYTAQHAALPRVLPEATAARRMGRMLTQELTINPPFDLNEETTQAHPAGETKTRT